MIDIVLFYVHMFACDSGECVRESLVCDDINDCGDFSDEDQCGMWARTRSLFDVV